MDEDLWRARTPDGDVEVSISGALKLWVATARWGNERVKAVGVCPHQAKRVAVRVAAQIQEAGSG